MKVQIESQLIETGPEAIIQFNYIVKMLNKMQTLRELKHWEQLPNINLFRIGFGSNHCWVKQYDSAGTLSDNRLLLVTEN
jgi:hypothetical protein